MKKEYIPISEEQKLGYLQEELGELSAALGKSRRWGLDSFNPELPPNEQETNAEWVLREIKDVKRALRIIEKHLEAMKGA